MTAALVWLALAAAPALAEPPNDEVPPAEPAPVLKAIPLPEPPAPLPPMEPIAEPPAPSWPGALAFWLGGVATSGAGTLNLPMQLPFCFDCSPVGPFANSFFMVEAVAVGSGAIAMLAGMGWLIWTQSPWEPRPKSPGVGAIIAGVLQLGASALDLRYVSPSGALRSDGERTIGVLFGESMVLLAAGVAWLIWSTR